MLPFTRPKRGKNLDEAQIYLGCKHLVLRWMIRNGFKTDNDEPTALGLEAMAGAFAIDVWVSEPGKLKKDIPTLVYQCGLARAKELNTKGD